MPPLPADFIHARACKLKCEKILTRPLQAEYATLLAEKKAAYTELRKARDEARELLTVKTNVDRVLQDTGRGIAQEKEHGQR